MYASHMIKPSLSSGFTQEKKVYIFAKTYTNVQRGFICNSPKLQIARMSITVSTRGQIVMCPSNGMPFSHKSDEVWVPAGTGKGFIDDAEWKELT